eukprot:scaffold387_cov244-Pinguiococcus_pyrenoidosus.AAC.8
MAFVGDLCLRRFLARLLQNLQILHLSRRIIPHLGKELLPDLQDREVEVLLRHCEESIIRLLASWNMVRIRYQRYPADFEACLERFQQIRVLVVQPEAFCGKGDVEPIAAV